MNAFIISAVLIVLAGFMAMSYRGYAERYAWPIGSIWYKKESLISFLVWVAIIPGVIELIYKIGILKGIGVSIGLFILAPIVMYIFKTWSQYLIYLFVLLSAIIWIIGGAEVVNI